MQSVRTISALQTAGCGGSSYSWRRVPERQMKLKRSSKDTDRSRREHSGTADLWKKLRIFLLSPRGHRGAEHSAFRESGACRLKIHCPDPRDYSSNAAQRSEDRHQPPEKVSETSKSGFSVSSQLRGE